MIKQPSLVKKQITEEEAIAFLEQRGYSVIKEGLSQDSLTDCDVLALFNSLIKKRVGTDIAFISQAKDSTEKKAIKDFISKSKNLKISRKEAFQLLKSSIELVFKYYEELGLTTDITSLRFLLSKDGSWILEKAMKIHKNKMIEFEASSEGETYKEQFYDFEDETLIKLRKERHKKILGESDGKKENK